MSKRNKRAGYGMARRIYHLRASGLREGDIRHGRVTRSDEHGVFVKVDTRVYGLARPAQLPDGMAPRHFEPRTHVTVMVVGVDLERGRLALQVMGER